MKKTFGDYFVLLISIIGSFASIIAYYQFIMPNLNDQGKYGVLFLGILSLYFLACNFYFISKYRKKSRYSDVFEELYIGNIQINSSLRENIKDIKTITSNLQNLCNHLKSIFTDINGHTISVCIKLIFEENDKFRVRTLCRDSLSNTQRIGGEHDNVVHWISENSDFDFITKNIKDGYQEKDYYFANWIPIKYGYRNSRLTDNSNPRHPFKSIILRIWNWPLKYKSSVVVPIIPRTKKDDGKLIRGFLCMDSPRNVAFDEEIDILILKGIADNIYVLIDRIHNSLKVKEGR